MRSINHLFGVAQRLVSPVETKHLGERLRAQKAAIRCGDYGKVFSR